MVAFLASFTWIWIVQPGSRSFILGGVAGAVMMFATFVVMDRLGLLVEVRERLVEKVLRWDPQRKVPTLRGDLVRSRGEAAVADFLYLRDVHYAYEPRMAGRRPDFYLPQIGVIVEYWGMQTSEYMRRRREKTEDYRRAGIPYVNLEPEDDIDAVLAQKLYRWDKGIYTRRNPQPRPEPPVASPS